MATAKTTKTPPDSEPRTAASLVDPEELAEAKAQAAAQLEKMNTEKDEADVEDFSAPRRRTGGADTVFIPDKTMPISEFVPNLDYRYFGPTAFAAKIHGPRTGTTGTQEFTLDPDRVKYLCFTKPNQNLPKKRLYTIKAFHRDGRLVQLPFELQIQNNAGGDPIDAIGLRRYQRKGIHILIDWNTMQPIYCAAWGCFAKADGTSGFCGQRHASHTLPNKFKDAGAIAAGVFGENATTSRIWQS